MQLASIASSSTNGILEKTIHRLDTIISVTVAGSITKYLQQQNPYSYSSSPSSSTIPTILTAIVVFFISFLLPLLFPSNFAQSIFTSFRSITGVIVTTTLMQIISNIGNSQGISSNTNSGNVNSSQLFLLTLSSTKYNLPVLLLGTVFVVAAGAIPPSLKNTSEGNAMYVGIQYAYSDILTMNLSEPQVRNALAMIFVVLFPWFSDMFEKILHFEFDKHGPILSWKEAMEFAGTSFVIDSIIPSFRTPGEYAEEELLRGIVLVGIVHAVLFAIQTNKEKGNSLGNSLGHTLESIGAFTTWRVGKKFASIIDTRLPYVGTIQLLIILLVLLALNQSFSRLVGQSFPKVSNDLMVMIGVYKLASSVMFVFQNNGSMDAVILLFAGLVSMRLFIKIFV